MNSKRVKGWQNIDKLYAEYKQVIQSMNFRLARDQVVHLETAANLLVSRRQANDFFAFFLFLNWEV